MSENITRKYRPRTLSSVIGQPVATKSIQSTLTSGKIPPAYLFYGIQGSGKTTLARLIAMSTNCTNRTGVEPCGQCQPCKDIINDCSDMLAEYDGATHSGVGDLRDMMAAVKFMVPDGMYKVVIIDECHALSKQAWQAALKTIEEPPRNVMFIFCTTEIQKVIATIKSRCVQLQFAGIDDAVILTMLKNICTAEEAAYDEKALQLIAKNSNGSIRDAQSILEGFIRTGKVSTDLVKSVYQTLDPMSLCNFFNYILTGNAKAAAKTAHGWLKTGASPDLIIGSLMEHLRNMIMDFTVEDDSLKAILKSQREKIGDGRVGAWIEFLYEQLRFLREYPMSHWLLIDLVTIRFISTASEAPVKASTKKAKETKNANASVAPLTEAAIPPVHRGSAVAG